MITYYDCDSHCTNSVHFLDLSDRHNTKADVSQGLNIFKRIGNVVYCLNRSCQTYTKLNKKWYRVHRRGWCRPRFKNFKNFHLDEFITVDFETQEKHGCEVNPRANNALCKNTVLGLFVVYTRGGQHEYVGEPHRRIQRHREP